jgi:hypothetical protein
MLDVAAAALNTIHLSEAHTYHEARIRAPPDLFGPTLRAYLRLGALTGVADYLRAQPVRQNVPDPRARREGPASGGRPPATRDE